MDDNQAMAALGLQGPIVVCAVLGHTKKGQMPCAIFGLSDLAGLHLRNLFSSCACVAEKER